MGLCSGGGVIIKYLLNIKTGIIHNGDTPCYQGKRMKEDNKKYFETLEEAVNYYGGDRKGVCCGICLKGRKNKE